MDKIYFILFFFFHLIELIFFLFYLIEFFLLILFNFFWFLGYGIIQVAQKMLLKRR